MKKVILVSVVSVVCIAAGLAAYIFVLFGQMSVVSKGGPIAVSAAETPALLVIDVQEGLTGDLGTSFCKDLKAQSEPLIASINKAVGWADASGIPVVYIRQESTDRLYNLLTKGITAKGGPAAEVDKRVKLSGSNIFGKQKMDAFSNSDLDAFFRSKGVNKLYVTGLDAEYCVDRTIKGGLVRGYKVTVLKDAVISGTAEKRDKMLVKYETEGVNLITSSELPEKNK